MVTVPNAKHNSFGNLSFFYHIELLRIKISIKSPNEVFLYHKQKALTENDNINILL